MVPHNKDRENDNIEVKKLHSHVAYERNVKNNKNKSKQLCSRSYQIQINEIRVERCQAFGNEFKQELQHYVQTSAQTEYDNNVSVFVRGMRITPRKIVSNYCFKQCSYKYC